MSTPKRRIAPTLVPKSVAKATDERLQRDAPGLQTMKALWEGIYAEYGKKPVAKKKAKNGKGNKKPATKKKAKDGKAKAAKKPKRADDTKSPIKQKPTSADDQSTDETVDDSGSEDEDDWKLIAIPIFSKDETANQQKQQAPQPTVEKPPPKDEIGNQQQQQAPKLTVKKPPPKDEIPKPPQQHTEQQEVLYSDSEQDEISISMILDDDTDDESPLPPVTWSKRAVLPPASNRGSDFAVIPAPTDGSSDENPIIVNENDNEGPQRDIEMVDLTIDSDCE